ncbi:uncharacterized protein [Amphiura filiformis]|uniref:uncharacterized protein n=1 Tax=Amphiura filiformis TaxID=82378 RepID=UPI003B20B683
MDMPASPSLKSPSPVAVHNNLSDHLAPLGALTSIYTDTRPSRRKVRRIKCDKCDNCLRDDCKMCNFCKDMRKYGGPGRHKQKCIRRRCSNLKIPNKYMDIGAVGKLRQSSKMKRCPDVIFGVAPAHEVLSTKNTTIEAKYRMPGNQIRIQPAPSRITKNILLLQHSAFECRIQEPPSRITKNILLLQPFECRTQVPSSRITKNNLQPFECRYCLRWWPDFERYRRHIRRHSKWKGIISKEDKRSRRDRVSLASRPPSKTRKLSSKKRRSKCGICDNCLRDNCKECKFCKDMKRYGGPGTWKQKCEMKRCSNEENMSRRDKVSLASKTRKSSSKEHRIKCGLCDNCLRDDCGECRFCKDMKKYGGPGRLRQSCKMKRCLNLMPNKCNGGRGRLRQSCKMKRCSNEDKISRRDKVSLALKTRKSSSREHRIKCGKCRLLGDECAECKFCKDMKKYGGPGRLRQSCKMKRCSNLMPNKCNSGPGRLRQSCKMKRCSNGTMDYHKEALRHFCRICGSRLQLDKDKRAKSLKSARPPKPCSKYIPEINAAFSLDCMNDECDMQPSHMCTACYRICMKVKKSNAYHHLTKPKEWQPHVRTHCQSCTMFTESKHPKKSSNKNRFAHLRNPLPFNLQTPNIFKSIVDSTALPVTGMNHNTEDQELAQLFECEVCMSVLKMPVMTKCEHFFCATCLTKLFQNQRSHEIACPTCKQKIRFVDIREPTTLFKLAYKKHRIAATKPMAQLKSNPGAKKGVLSTNNPTTKAKYRMPGNQIRIQASSSRITKNSLLLQPFKCRCCLRWWPDFETYRRHRRRHSKWKGIISKENKMSRRDKVSLASRPPSKTRKSSSNKRRSKCGICDNCLRDDCGECKYCKDMKKYGGPGRHKQKCEMKHCSNLMPTKYNGGPGWLRQCCKMKQCSNGTMDYHKEALRHFCRICGSRLQLDKRAKSLKPCSKYIREINAAFSLNCMNDVCDKHPSHMCTACYRICLKVKESNAYQHYQHLTKPEEWQPHVRTHCQTCACVFTDSRQLRNSSNKNRFAHLQNSLPFNLQTPNIFKSIVDSTALPVTGMNHNTEDQELVQLFECKVCMSVLNMPVMTKCEHFFCATCLTELFQNQRSHKITCPTCKQNICFEDISETPNIFKSILDSTALPVTGMNHNTEELAQLFKCKVCTSLLNMPVMTQCEHFFCATCLTILFQNQRSQDIACPTCKQNIRFGDIREPTTLFKLAYKKHRITATNSNGTTEK